MNNYELTESPNVFVSTEFGELRTTLSADGEPMFCLIDVCRALGIGNVTDTQKRLDPKGFDSIEAPTSGGLQSMIFVNEANLYRTISQSRKAKAIEFQDWVFYEVLPSIRKHGAYLTNEKIEQALTDPDTLIKLATELKNERTKRLEAEREAQAKAQQIAQDAPKVTFANAILGSATSCLIGELAKILTRNGFTIGQNRLFKYLRDNGFLWKCGESYNIPNQRYIEQGLFDLKRSAYSDKQGVLHQLTTTKVTPKGQQYFINKFLNHEEVRTN